MRVVNVAEKDINARPAKPVVVLANTSTDVLPDTTDSRKEFCGRYVFNDSGSVAFYAIGQDCSAVSYHGKIQNQQQLDCSNHGQRVSVFSVAGGTFVPTELFRNDLIQVVNIL